MKKTLILCGALLMLFQAAAETVHYPVNDPAIKFAARDIARCLTAISGRNYISRQSDAKNAAAGDIILTVDKTLADQEWHLYSRDGKLYIAGCDVPGILYGIYTFLEKYASCAWLAPDTELLPAQPGWKIPQIDEKNKPAFIRREMFVSNDFMDGIWRLRNKENFRASFVNYNYGSPRDCHTFDDYVKFIKDPKLFGPSKSGGKCHTLCMTNPEVRRIVLEELLKNIAKDRAKAKSTYSYPRIYDISQPDGGSGGECWCKGCRELAEKEGSYSGPNLDFVNYLAREVAKKYPDVFISTFAYSYTTNPPKTLKAEKNVVIRYCSAWVFNPLIANTKQGDMLKNWCRHTYHISLLSYWRTYKGTLFPQVKSRADIADEIRFCRQNNVSMYYAECEQPLERSFAMLQHYLMLKMLENPDRDIYKLAGKFLEGYYGKAAPAMLEYLNYLEKRQEETRSFLDKEFFETVNSLLDKAEAAVLNDPRSALHVAWERVIVDRSMYDNLANLTKSGYKPDMQKVAARFAKNSKAVISAWSPLNARPQIKNSKIKAVEMESELYKYFPVEIPAQFKGCEVIDMHWTQIRVTALAGGRVAYVKDPDAVCGTAFYNPNYKIKSNYSIGFYNGLKRTGDGINLTAADIPNDGKFHLYKLGNATIMVPLFINFDDSWHFRAWLSTVGIVPEEWDIWVSMKFAGPRFVSGSKDPNRVLFDRILLVKDPDPLRHYKPVDPSKNLLKNAGFEKSFPGWIDSWGKPSANCMIDTTEKHSGKASLKIGNKAKGYIHIQQNLADLDKLNGDLLIRGWYKYANVETTTGHILPFVGLWTLTPQGRNGYSKNLLNFYSGSYNWQYFEKIISIEDFKRSAKRANPASTRLTFRLNINTQPGWVWVDDLEVIPLEKK